MKIDKYNGRDEWLSARSTDYGIGASTVPAILGLSGFTSPWDVWAKWHAPEAVEQDEESPQLVRGHLLEPHLLRLYGKLYTADVEHHEYTICSHDKQPWARFSPDGVVSDGGIVEIKTARNGWAWRDAPDVIETAHFLDDLPTAAYGIQCYWQLLISGAPYCDLVVLPLGHELAAVADALATSTYSEALGVLADAIATAIQVVRIMPDQEFMTRMGAKVAAWRQRHLIEGVEPEARGTAASAYHGERPKRGEVELDVDHPVVELADALHHAKTVKKEVDSEVKFHMARIKQAMQNVSQANTPRGSIRWRKHGRGKTIVLSDWVASQQPKVPDEVPTLTPTEEESNNG